MASRGRRLGRGKPNRHYSLTGFAAPVTSLLLWFTGHGNGAGLTTATTASDGDPLQATTAPASGFTAYDTTLPFRGSSDARFSAQTTAGLAYGEWGTTSAGVGGAGTSSGQHYVRLRVRFPVMPPDVTGVPFAQFLDSVGNVQGQLIGDSNGKIKLSDGAGTVLGTSTATFGTSTWTDVGLAITTYGGAGVGQLEAKIYNFGSVAETLSGAADTLRSGGPVRVRMGMLRSLSFMSVDIQDIGWSTTTYPTLPGAAVVESSTTTYTTANTTTVTTASFTPANNTLLVAYCSMGNGTASASSLGAVTDSLSGTWTRLAGEASASGGVAEVWARDVGTGAAMTVTYDPGGAGASGLDIIVKAYLQAAPVASQPGSTAVNGGGTAYSKAITTTTAGSIVAGALGRASDAQTVVANASSTLLGQVNGSAGDTAALFVSAAQTVTPGAVTLGFTNGAAGVNRIALAEILPASTGGTSSISLSDAGSAADALAVTAAVAVSDSGAGSDALAAAATAPIAETGSAADAAAVAATAGLTDTGAASDAAAVSASTALVDTGSAADVAAVAVTAAATDTGSAADAVAVTVPKALVDAGSSTDSIAVAAAGPLTDAGSAADTLAVIVVKAVADSGAAGDTLAAAVIAPLTDTGSAADALTTSVTAPLTDAGTAADALAANAAAPLAESATAADVVTASATVPIPDAGSASDGVAAGVPISVTDTGSASDALTLSITVALADTGTAADLGKANATAALADAGTAVDLLGVLVALAVAEAASAVEALSVARSVALTDAGSATDALGVASTIVLADAGAASDALAALGSVVLAETGAGADALTVAGSIALVDAAAASDAVTVQQLGGPTNVALADTGSASDRLCTVLHRPSSGTTGRPATGTTTRPASGSTTRPAAGTTTRPYTGITYRG